MRIRILITTVALAALATVTSIAQDETYTLKPVAKKDDVYNYKVVGQFEVQGSTADFTAKFSQKVVAVDGDKLTFEQRQSDPHVQFGGQEVPMPDDSPVITAIYKANGELDVLKAADDKYTGADSYRAAALETLLVPDKPVKIGDTWSYKSDTVPNKWKKIQVDYKVLATEKIGTYDCVKVSFDAKELEGGDDAASEKGNVWLAKSDFSLIKREAKVTNLPLPGSPMPLNGTIKFERDDAAPAPPAAAPKTGGF